MYYVYILHCSDNTYYTGCTNNLERRLHQHNALKKGARYTRIRRPVTLKYHESFQTLAEARKREYEIKTWTRAAKDKLVNIS